MGTKSFGRVIITVAFALTFVGCNYNIQKVPSTSGAGGGSNQGAGVPPGSIPVGDPALNFENVFATSIKTSCFTCHAAPRNASGINLETYESVFANRAAVEQAVSSREMPDGMGRTMDDAARDLLLRWLAAGAPRTAPVALIMIDSGTGLLRQVQGEL